MPESSIESSADEEKDTSYESEENFQPVLPTKRTRSGRTIFPRKFYHEECMGVCTSQPKSNNYYDVLEDEETDGEDEEFYESELMREMTCVGAGIGGGYEHSNELKTMNYKDAMQSEDKKEWEQEVDIEHGRMVKYNVWEAVPESEVPEGTVPLTSTWAFKKKSNGTRRGRLNAHGFK